MLCFCAADPTTLTTMSDGNSSTDGRTPCRYPDTVFVNGGGTVQDGDCCGGYDVKSLLQDAPADSIRQQTRVNREESIIDSSSLDSGQDDANEKVDLDFVDGQVLNEIEAQYCMRLRFSQIVY